MATPSDPSDEFIARMHEISHRVAFEPEAWTPKLAAEIRALFDERAATWSEGRHRGEYLHPLAAALEDTAAAPGGTCLDVGSGTAIHEATLEAHFRAVVSVDLSFEMLTHAASTAAHLVRGDASRLPLRDGAVDAVVCVNMFLFPAEYVRVLRPGGVVVFCSTWGAQTPIYLDPREVTEALAETGGGRFSAVTSNVGAGSYTVCRRLGDDVKGTTR